MKNPLTSKELTDLGVFENIIKVSEKATWAFLAACQQIKERKLYRRDYDTWEVYCLKKWGWTARRQHQIESAAAVTQQLAQESGTICSEIKNEGQARALAKVTPAKRKEVVKAIVESGRKVTAAAIEQEANKKDIELDRTGRRIPDALLPLWERNDEVQGILTKISHIKGVLERAQQDRDAMYAEVNFSSVIGDLEKAWKGIQTAKAYAVCPTCQGHPETQPDGKCRLCIGRGLISEFRWDRLVPAEIKKVIEKGVKH
jgi:hypothetical protein